MTIDDLRKIAPPEGVAPGGYSAAEWERAEAAFGIVFPGDYKDLVNTYRTGCFGGYLWLLNPFPDVPGWRNVGAFVPDYWDHIRQVRAASPGYFYGGPLWPEPGGLFPWCRDDNAGLICWEADPGRDPLAWTSVRVDGHLSPAVSTYPFSATGVLYKFLTKEITFWDEEDGEDHPASVHPPFSVQRGAAGYR